MAKDKTRERELPEWLKQRKSFTVRASDATRTYHQLGAVPFVTIHDGADGWRQGARIR